MTAFWKSVCPLIIIVMTGLADGTAKFIRRSNGDSTGVDGITSATYPWQAALYRKNFFYGSAVIIGKDNILTTASLVFERNTSVNPYDITIYVGSHQLRSEMGETHKVQAVILHPGFTTKFPVPHNLAILKLRTQIQFDETKRAIPLPTADIFEPTPVVTTGWKNNLMERVSPYLQKYNLTIVNNTRCQSLMTPDHLDRQWFENKSLLDSQVCAESGSANWDCEFQGNVGCPLVSEGVLVGINSWGSSCYGGLPIVHTRIYKYLDWISDTMQGLEMCHWY